MRPDLDMNKIARGLRAEPTGDVSAGGGYFGAMLLLANIETRLRVPLGGGRTSRADRCLGLSEGRPLRDLKTNRLTARHPPMAITARMRQRDRRTEAAPCRAPAGGQVRPLDRSEAT